MKKILKLICLLVIGTVFTINAGTLDQKWAVDSFVPNENQTLKAVYEINNPNTVDSIWSIVGACSLLAILLVGMIILIKKFKD